MKEKYPLVIGITALITALVAGGLVFLLTGNGEGIGNGEVAELQEQVAALQQENAALQDENAALKEENEALLEAREIHRQPKAGWEQYFPDDAETTTLQGESIDDVRQLLGEPPFLVRSTAANPQNNREIWVYTPFEDDPTGLYLFFKGGRLASSRLDEFPGLRQAYFWDDEGFWQN